MPRKSPRTTVRVDGDGVRIVRTPGVRGEIWVFIVALAAIGVALLVFGRSTPQPTEGERLAQSAGGEKRASAPGSRASGAVRAAPVARADRAPIPAQSNEMAPRDPPPLPGASADTSTAGAQADAQAPAEPSGIALFPPMGTDPIKRGIIVPDDFALPPGYVRHYQVTDDGAPLPAILMFHPDYHPVDEHGEPVALPKDRVVPPEMAPPGLAIQMLDVPDDGDPAARQAGEEHEPAR